MITPDFYIYPHFSVRSTIPHTPFRPHNPNPDGGEKDRRK